MRPERACGLRSNNHPDGTSGSVMISLKYEAPSSLGDAIALLACSSGTSRVLAGGTDVIVQMETDRIEPDLVVDIKKIPELREIAVENGGFRVGAAVTGMELTDHRGFCRAWPGVVDGVKLIGSMQIKGRATMGGNLRALPARTAHGMSRSKLSRSAPARPRSARARSSSPSCSRRGPRVLVMRICA